MHWLALALATLPLLPLLGLPAAFAIAQQPQFGASVDVVEVYASVTDPDGTPIERLAAERFSVYEDGVRQHVSTFIEADFPLSVAIAVDRSWSMAGQRLPTARRGAATLLRALRPDDQAMIVAISGEVEVIVPLSTDRAAQQAALDRLDPWSTTALHDAILATVDRVQAGSGRRALVLLSDGSDRYSRAPATDVLARIRRSDVMIYPVAIGRESPPLFAELAATTGGRSFHVRDAAALDRAMAQIARELRSQYLLGYSPARPRTEDPGAWRTIRVEVLAPGARVRARDGYVND